MTHSSNTDDDARSADKRQYRLDEPRIVTRIYYGLIVLCALSVLADLFYEKHVHYEAETIVGAYGIFGFVACVALMIGAKGLRRLLQRDENYYGDDD